MIFTFYKAQGKSTGSSLVEEDKVELAKSLIASAKEKGVELLLPTDVVIADKFAADANTKIVSVDDIPDGWMVRHTSLTSFLSARRSGCVFAVSLARIAEGLSVRVWGYGSVIHQVWVSRRDGMLGPTPSRGRSTGMHFITWGLKNL